MLRALLGVRSACASWIRRSTSTIAAEASTSTEEAKEEKEEVVGEEEVSPITYANKEKYSLEAIAKLKLDQYPFYVEREWWKPGKRMTFWATWRQNRDFRRRELLQKLGADRMRYKALKENTVLPQAIRDAAAETMFTMPKYSHPRLILNMCMFTGRQRGKIKPYRLNRHLFRKMADHSQLSGVQRAMW